MNDYFILDIVKILHKFFFVTASRNLGQNSPLSLYFEPKHIPANTLNISGSCRFKVITFLKTWILISVNLDSES